MYSMSIENTPPTKKKKKGYMGSIAKILKCKGLLLPKIDSLCIAFKEAHGFLIHLVMLQCSGSYGLWLVLCGGKDTFIIFEKTY